MKLILVVFTAITFAGCHRAPPAFGPDRTRTRAECEAVIARVRADTDVRNAPRATAVEVLVPLPLTSVQGQTATVRFPVDEHGRVSSGEVSITGLTDPGYVAALRSTIAKGKWKPAARDGCWVPSLMQMSFAFAPSDVSPSGPH
jgi:hypothetical protein